MSISPPSDIVLDVTRAADPSRLSAAAGRLQQMARSSAAGTDFGDMMMSYEADAAGADDVDFSAIEDVANRAVAAPAPPGAKALDPSDSYGAFEAMVLSNFVEAMMPKDSAVFGNGTAGEVWASMMAQNIAGEIAKRGGVGIADQLRGASGDHSSARASLAALDQGGIPDSAAVVDAVAANGERSFLAALGPIAAGGAGSRT